MIAQVHQENVSVSADTDLSMNLNGWPLGWTVGIAARQNGDTFYLGQIRRDQFGDRWADIIRTVNGATTTLYSHKLIPATSGGRLRFDVSGSTLGLYVNDVLVAGCSDDQITGAGFAGFFSSGAQVKTFDNVSVTAKSVETPQTASLPFYDTFTRTTAGLGPNWNVRYGSVNGMQNLVSFGFNTSLATLNTAGSVNVDISADISALGGKAALIARYDAQTGSYYYAQMNPIYDYGMDYEIGKVVNGGSPVILQYVGGPRVARGRLDFNVVGGTLKLSMNGTVVASVNDETFVNAGQVGLRGDHDASIDNFEVDDEDAALTAPTAPSGLLAISNGASSVGLTWNDALGETAYTLERADGGSNNFAPLATQPSRNTTQFSDGSVTPGQSYWYRLRSSNAAGHSAWTAIAEVTVAIPGAATDITVSHTTNNQLAVNWTAATTGGESGYVVQRRTDTSGWMTVATLDRNTNYFIDSGLDPDTAYKYQVTATNGIGNSVTITAASVVPSQPPVYPPPPVTPPTYLSTVRVGVTPGQNTASFGTDLPAGIYTISYVSGAWTSSQTGWVAGTDPARWDWNLLGTVFKSTSGFSVSGTEIPGLGLRFSHWGSSNVLSFNGGASIDATDDIEQESQGKSIIINHPGGPLSIQFDNPQDNTGTGSYQEMDPNNSEYDFGGSVVFGLEEIPFSLSVADDNLPNHQVTVSTTAPASLELMPQSNGTAAVDISTLIDGESTASANIVWKLVDGTTGDNSGNFALGHEHANFAVPSVSQIFIVEAAYDSNHNGIMDEQPERVANLKINSVDIDIDSNNDKVIDPDNSPTGKDDPIEADVGKPGQYLDIDNTDADSDGIPDYADGFHIAGASQAHDTDLGAHFVQVKVTVPSYVDISTAEFSFAYSASDPALIAIPSNEVTAKEWDYSLPVTGGQLRLWRKDANIQRSSESISAGGDYIAPGTFYTAEQLGLTESSRTAVLYVEAVSRNSADYHTAIPITVSYSTNGNDISSTDTVNATAVYNPDGWRALARKEANFDLKLWNPTSGFTGSQYDLDNIYYFYEKLYKDDYAAHGNGATLGRFQWAGLAKMAGGSVVFTLETMNDPVAYLSGLLGVSNQSSSWGSYVSSVIGAALPTSVTGNLSANLTSVQTTFMQMAFAIFSDIAWQHLAYRDGGISEIHRLGNTADLPGPLNTATGGVDLVSAWDNIDSGNPVAIWAGNFQIANYEQNITLAPGYAVLRSGWMMNPTVEWPAGLSVSQALTIGSYLKAPFPGAPTFAEYAATLLPAVKFLTVEADRWLYIGGSLWGQWK